MAKPRELAVGRCIGGLFAAACLIASAASAWWCWQRVELVRGWERETLLSMPVDLSQAGIRTASMQVTVNDACKQAILFTAANHPGEFEPQPELDGLKATLKVETPEGEAVASTHFETTWSQWRPDGLVVASFWPLPAGRYIVKLDVEEPAPQFAGVTQRLWSRYETCGLEYFPALFAGAFAGFTFLIGLWAALAYGPDLWRHGIHRSATDD